MYIYIYIYMYTNMYTYMHSGLCIYIYIYTYDSICMYYFWLCCSLCSQAVAPPNAHGSGTCAAFRWPAAANAHGRGTSAASMRIWAAGGGAVRLRPCSGAGSMASRRRARRRIRVGVTCKMSWLMLHMLRLRVQFVQCLMHELLYMTLFMPAGFRCKLFQTCVSQNLFPSIPISDTFFCESGYWEPSKLNLSLTDLFHKQEMGKLCEEILFCYRENQ